MRGAFLSAAASKKLIITLEDSAPKTNHGSMERVKWLLGSNTAGAKTHNTYQCWNQNDPTRRYNILTAIRLRHTIWSASPRSITGVLRQRLGRKLNIHRGMISAPAANSQFDIPVLS